MPLRGIGYLSLCVIWFDLISTDLCLCPLKEFRGGGGGGGEKGGMKGGREEGMEGAGGKEEGKKE